MNRKAKPINRVHGVYSESATGIASGYALLQSRLIDLNLASTRNMMAIDELILRLRSATASALDPEPSDRPLARDSCLSAKEQ